jgi:hypothetical protein
MKRPVRSTLVFGLISALAVMPAAGMLAALTGWSLAVKLVLWTDLLVYALLLTRWSGTGPGAIVFPMVLLLGTALLPGTHAAFFLLGLGFFSWIRSGICFSATPLRAIAAEIVTIAVGAGLVVLLSPGSTIAWAIGVWLFVLVQALYFFMVPVGGWSAAVRTPEDPFASAYREAQRVMDEGG